MILKIRKGNDRASRFRPFLSLKERTGFYVECSLGDTCTYYGNDKVSTNTIYGIQWGNNSISLDYRFSEAEFNDSNVNMFAIFARWTDNGKTNVRYMGNARIGDRFSFRATIHPESSKVFINYHNHNINYKRSAYIRWYGKLIKIKLGRFLFPKLRAVSCATKDMYYNITK